MPPPAAPSPVFATTHWSLIADAHATETHARARALEALCRIYWPPAYAAIRRAGHSPENACDLTQDFFATLLARGFLPGADPSRGHFRGYLLGALKHFLADARDRESAQKRGGDRIILSIDALQAEESYAWEPIDTLTPDRLFDRRWALTVIARATSRLQEECTLSGKDHLFSVLKPFLNDSTNTPGYPQAAAALQQTEASVRMTVTRLRRRFAELIRAEVTETVHSPAEAEDELRSLLQILRDR
jgi:DNA-directed RNA polymerase specialized sigma24 family protein